MRMAIAAQEAGECINLTLGEPDITTPPEICKALCDAVNDGHTHYAPGAGLPSLREAVSSYWKRTYGLDYCTDEIYITTGGSHALNIVLHSILEKGDEVILLEPFFTFYEQNIEQSGGVPVYCMSGSDRAFVPDPAELEKKITPKTKAIILNSPCNPSGVVYNREVLLAIAEIAEKHDLLVISDEIYESYSFSEPHTPFASLPGTRGRTIMIAGLSKAYAMTGWRIGYTMCDKSMKDILQAIGAPHIIGVNTMVQKAAEFALNNCDNRVREISELFKKRVEYAAKEFAKVPGMQVTPAGGGFYLFPNISATGMTGEQFSLEMLHKAKVALIPGESFGPHCSDYVRIACTVSEEKLGEAANRMAEVMKKLI